MAVLIGTSGITRGQTYELSHDEVSIGRREENLITIDDSSVSGHHAQITHKNDAWLLRDLASTNGTHVNGQPVGETLLQERDQIKFGSVQLVFTKGSAADVNLNDLVEPDEDLDIEVTAELARAPSTFSSHSPFEVQRSPKKGLWNNILILIGIIALLGVGALFYLLFFAG